MKIKLNETLKNLDGATILMSPADRSKEYQLKEVIISSILTPIEKESQEDKWKKYEIFKKVRDVNDEVELKAEEIALIKKCIGHFQPQLIMGQCFEMIEKQ
jgi:hypothetical protein